MSGIHYAHTFTSVLARIGIVTSLLAAYLGLRRSFPHSVRRRWWFLIGCLTGLVALSAMLTLLVADVPAPGNAQAGMVPVAYSCFAAIGFGVLGARRSHAPAPAARRAGPGAR